MSIDYGALVLEQIDFYWKVYFRPRLDGLTDDEYLWEPVANCWSLRPDANGNFQIERTDPAPQPEPVTTIGWRLMHIADNLHMRASTFFGDGSVPVDLTMFDRRHRPASVPGTAAEGLAFLDRVYDWWYGSLGRAPQSQLEAPLGPRGEFFAESPLIALAMHTNREIMHHGGEILLLRDLYRERYRG